ncbi:MAG: hypothetical protein M3N47_00475 [Chloroflexota bacterium]|nr:hypothetical protein [Chloroflexota bacterium]
MVAGTAGTGAAEHGHFVLREDSSGETHCRYIAQGQTSKSDDDRGGHKFHDNVHTGPPGSDEHGTDFDKSDNEARCDTVEERGSTAQK